MTEAESDRVSCLPGHVIDNILSHLQIKEAVRTSVLSSKWRNKWYTLPNVVFDEHCVSTSTSQEPSVIYSRFIKMVDHVLLLHSGPINKFEIRCSNRNLFGVNSVTYIDRWIVHLTGKSIQELMLTFWIEQHYKIPWCLFSCQSLRRLKLYRCLLKLPKTFEGFRNLKCLDLDQVIMAQDAFESLIFSCPLLECLILTNIDNVTQINIHAPNLKVFDILDKFENINFENSCQLATVFVDLSLYLNSEQHNQSRLDGCSSNLLKFFDRRPHIKSLVIRNYFLKYLAVGVVPVKLPTPCIALSYLSLCINFNDLKEVLAVLCLLRNSPNLQKLEISARFKKQTVLLTPSSYCWEDIFSGPAMPYRVQHVTIHGIFIKFLLLYSPMLEKMIVKSLVNFRPELMKELIRFKRASKEVEVIYEGME